MLVITTEMVADRRTTKVLGLVEGAFSRDAKFGDAIMDTLRSWESGKTEEPKDRSRLLSECRVQALGRLVKDAESMGANAVVGLRISTTMIRGDRAEVFAYGTAIVTEQ